MEIYIATVPWNAYRQSLEAQLMVHGFTVRVGGQPVDEADQKRLRDTLDRMDVGVLLLPCGPEPCLEIGYMAGRGKPVFVLDAGASFPEIAHEAWRSVHSGQELVDALEKPR